MTSADCKELGKEIEDAFIFLGELPSLRERAAIAAMQGLLAGKWCEQHRELGD